MRLISLTALVLLVLTGTARAYIDPGSGSYVLQIVIAGLVASAFAVKTFWLNIVAFFGGIFGKRNAKRRDDG